MVPRDARPREERPTPRLQKYCRKPGPAAETVASTQKVCSKTEAEAAITQKKGEADAVAAKARKNLPQAVDYIMEKVVIAC